MNDRYQEVLATIERQYPGRIRLNVAQVAALTGIAKRTLYNRLSLGTFPVRFSRGAGHPTALVHDVARFVAEL